MEFEKKINDQIDLLYYFGEHLLAKNDNHFFVLNSIEKFIFEAIMQGVSQENLITSVKNNFKLLASREDIAQIIQNYFSSETGTALFSDCSQPTVRSIKAIGQSGRYYPKYLQIELTKQCNLSCPHCYKEANHECSYLPVENLYELSDFIGNNIQIVGFTGGEPLMHPDFEKIVTHFSKNASLELNSNGIFIHKIKDEILQRFSAMSISLYGLSDAEYLKNTNSSHSFDNLLSSGAKLKRLGIRFNASVIVTKEKMSQLEDYTKLAIELGAATLQFGTANAIGRGRSLLENDATWFLTLEEKREVYKTLRYLQKKYKNKIRVLEWNRDQYERDCTGGLSNIYPNKSLSCGSGTVQWVVNEKMQFRPCVICPEINTINFSFNDWKDYVLGRNQKNWKNITNQFNQYCQTLNIPIQEYCNRFEELLV